MIPGVRILDPVRWAAFLRAHALGLLVFLGPAAIRAIPELLAGPYPIGFDTVWVYAPFLQEVQRAGLGAAMARVESTHAAPLMYAVLGALGAVSGWEPILTVKVVGPLLHGFLVFSLVHFARVGLGWDTRRCLFLALLAGSHFLVLRFSWDMYRNAFGYGLFIIALAHAPPWASRRDLIAFLGLSILSVLTSEATAVLVLGVGAGTLLLSWIRDGARDPRWTPVLAAAAAALLVYVGALLPPSPAFTPLAAGPARNPVVENYIGLEWDVYAYPAVADLFVSFVLLGALLFAPLAVPASVGLPIDRRLAVWIGVLAVPVVSAIAIPFAAFSTWHRWMFMLGFPLLFLAANGLTRLPRRVASASVAVLLVLGAGFLVLPPQTALPVFTHPTTLPFLPSSMLQNGLPLDDVPDVLAVLEWLDAQAVGRSVLLAPAAFAGWAQLYSSVPEVYAFFHPDQVNGGDFSAYDRVFVLYWAPGEGWYRASLLPESLALLHEVNRIGVYERLATA